MKLVIIYRPNSEHARGVERFIQEYRDHHSGGRLDVLNIDSREGSATASLYDVMQYPAILALSNDGSVIKEWQGEVFPLIDEVAYYSSMGDPVAPGSLAGL